LEQAFISASCRIDLTNAVRCFLVDHMRFVTIAVFAAQLFVGPLFAAQDASRMQPTGSHGLRNEQFGLFLRPRDASNRTGEPIVLYPYQPWKCMAWRFDRSQDGVRLVNYFTSKSFEADLASGSKAVLQQPASPDQLTNETLHFVPLGGDLYEIEVQGNAGVLTAVDSDGHGDIRVVVSPWKQMASQKWHLVDLPDHFTG
jgi:hypothetical protein